jgi:hypothetical protein
MAQQSITRTVSDQTVSKKYLFKMSNTEIETWRSSEHGVIVSGRTAFSMNINASTARGSTTTPDYIIPDFTKTLTGIITLDENAPVVELRKVPLEEAKHIIHEYLKKHPGARTSDLIIELTLEPDLVIEALSQLRCEGKVEGKDVTHK